VKGINDINGKQICHIGVLNLTPEIRIPTLDFPAGINFIKVKKGKMISIQKFIHL